MNASQQDAGSNENQRGKSSVVVLVIILALVVVAAFFALNRLTGPWTEAGKTKVAFKSDMNEALSSLLSSYVDTRLVLNAIDDRLKKEGDTSNERYNLAFQATSQRRSTEWTAQIERTAPAIGKALAEANELYRYHDLTAENLKTIDSLGNEIIRNAAFHDAMAAGQVDAMTYKQWLSDEDTFILRMDRIKTELGIQ